MKAVVFRKGKGLQLENLPLPQIDSDQVLVKVANTGFCGSDHSLIETEGTPDGIILGHEVSGTVVDCGANVKQVEQGTRVIIRPTFCGKCSGCQMGKPQLCSNNRHSIGIGDLPGGFAEYIKVYPQMMIPVPNRVDSHNAALAELFAVALHAINQTGNQKGSVLVMGAGAVGLALVALLRILDFAPIAVSEPVEEKRMLAEQYGAHLTMDPQKDDLQAAAFHHTETAGFETVFECTGLTGMLSQAMTVAGIGGMVCQLSVIYQDIPINPAFMMFKELRLTGSYGNTHEENVQCLQWMAEGKLNGKPLISDWSTLEQLPRFYRNTIQPGKTTKVMLKIGEEF